MTRRTFPPLVVALSAALSAPTVILWALSFVRHASLEYRSLTGDWQTDPAGARAYQVGPAGVLLRTISFESADGGLWITRWDATYAPTPGSWICFAHGPGWNASGRSGHEAAHRSLAESRRLGFEWRRYDGNLFPLRASRYSARAVRVPYAAFAAAAALPLLAARCRERWLDGRARRRASLGLCPSCGYDLRGTPTLCPECGTPSGPPDSPSSSPASLDLRTPPPHAA